MSSLTGWIARHPRAVLALHALALGFALWILVDPVGPGLRLRIETAVDKVLPDEGPRRERYTRFRERFGNDEFLFVGLVTDDVFSRENLRLVSRLTERFRQADGIRHVMSLATAPDVRPGDGGVSVFNALDGIPDDPDGLEALRRRVLANPLLVGSLVSEDGRAAGFLLQPEPMGEAEFRERDIDGKVVAIAREEAPEARILLAGTPPLKSATSRILRRDLFRFVPLAYAVMAVVGGIAFRSLRRTLIPLLAVGIAQLWTLAAMVLAERSLNLITFIVPVLVIAVGFAYSVHVVAEHADAVRRGRRGSDAVAAALGHVGFAVWLTALTTAAGFASLCLSPLPAIREFGLFCVVGTLASLVAALSLTPAVLSLLPEPALPPGGAPEPRANRFDRAVERLGRQVVAHPRRVLAAGGLVAALAALGVARIELSTAFTTNLDPEHPLRRDIHGFDERLGGSLTLHVVLESDQADAFKDPETLRELAAVQRWLEAQPEVAHTSSIADYVMVLNRALHAGDEEHYRVPDSHRLLAQYLFFFWHDDLTSLVSSDFSAADVRVRIPAGPSGSVAPLLDRIDARLAEVPGTLRAHVTGDTPMIVRTVDEIAWGQAVTLCGAVLVIYAILLAYFRSPHVAGMALVPNALPVVVYFGVLGLSGITLNLSTSLIACIILGIAVDDTIHFLVRFREHVRTLRDEREAAVAALRGVARAVTSTSAALSAGFLALAVSGLRHQQEFAVLAACMLAFAWVVDMTFTPALCSRMRLAGRGRAGALPPAGSEGPGAGAGADGAPREG